MAQQNHPETNLPLMAHLEEGALWHHHHHLGEPAIQGLAESQSLLHNQEARLQIKEQVDLYLKGEANLRLKAQDEATTLTQASVAGGPERLIMIPATWATVEAQAVLLAGTILQ